MRATMPTRSADQIIAETESLLETARFGLRDMQTTAERRSAGFRNAVVFGRTVTLALQNLRSVRPDFDDWYKSEAQALAADPLMRFFVSVRNMIEKQARTPLSRTISIGRFSIGSMDDFGPAPPGATSFVIGDPTGQAGWVIPQPDGSIQMYYVSLPWLKIETTMIIADTPIETGMAHKPAHELVAVYLDRLAALVKRARARFAI